VNDREGHSKSLGGSWLGLRAQFAVPRIWWGPLWAAWCGAVATGVLDWDGAHLLRVVLVLVLADPLVANLCHLVFDAEWPATGAEKAVEAQDVPVLPYTVGASPGHRLGQWLNRTAGWWKSSFWPQAGWLVSSVALEVVGLLTLGAVLGQPVMRVVILGLGGMGLALLTRTRAAEFSLALRAVIETGLVWLIGYMAFAPLALPALLLAGLYAVAYWAGLRALTKGLKASAVGVAGALVGMAVLLIIIEHPVSGALVGLLGVFPIGLSLAWRGQILTDRYVRSIQFYMLAATLLSALSVKML